jgi:serine/threonine protein kinase/tetratricopeptide (TPR) repeat protein
MDAGGPSAAAFERGAVLGRYVVLDQLGVGGMGVVYKAYDPDLNRPVALKLLQAAGEPAAGQRLLREAQALAQLSHPNVVSIYDVGSLGSRVFIATEFVDGMTLRSWLKQRPRSQREILDVYLAAGEGLAAAHRAGLVHRDFKPDNVMVGSDDRVRVLDFGLVRASSPEAPPAASTTAEGPSEPTQTTLGDRPTRKGRLPQQASAPLTAGERPSPTPLPEVLPIPGNSSSRLLSPLTQMGSIMGTPRYMAPEQHTGDVADARADQFSFCVSLYEGLYGTPPFVATTLPLLREAVVSGTVAPPPAASRVPRWLRQVLLRGLRPNPATRYPSMRALLDDLEKVPARYRRRWWMAGALLSVVALGAGSLQLRRSRAAMCEAPGTELTGVWGGTQRTAVSAAFRRTRAPKAETSLRDTLKELDAYANAWMAMRYDACAATRMRGEQSEQMLDLRMECLAQRRTELDALVTLLSSADEKLVAHGPEAVRGLSELGICANARALRAPVRPPSDAKTQAKVSELRGRLASANAVFSAAHYTQALPLVQPIVQEALALGYTPLEAEALYLQGRIQSRLGDNASSENAFRDALANAVDSGHDEIAARTADALGRAACDASHFNESLLWERLAQSFGNRVGSQVIEDSVQIGLGNVYEVTGRYTQAQTAYARALELRQKISGPTDPSLGHPLLGLGLVLQDQRRWAEALAMYRRALAIQERSLGSDHPDIGMTLTNISQVLSHLGRTDEALGTGQRARAIFEPALGPDHPYVVAVLEIMAEARLAKGDYSDGLPAMRAIVIRMDKAFGADSPDAALPHVVLGEALRKAHQPAAALAEQQHALLVLEKALGSTHPHLAEPLVSIGRAALDLGQTRLAEQSLRRALEIGIADPTLKTEAQAALDRTTASER